MGRARIISRNGLTCVQLYAINLVAMTLDGKIQDLRDRLARIEGSRRERARLLGVPEASLRKFEDARKVVSMRVAMAIEEGLARVESSTQQKAA